MGGMGTEGRVSAGPGVPTGACAVRAPQCVLALGAGALPWGFPFLQAAEGLGICVFGIWRRCLWGASPGPSLKYLRSTVLISRDRLGTPDAAAQGAQETGTQSPGESVPKPEAGVLWTASNQTSSRGEAGAVPWKVLS